MVVRDFPWVILLTCYLRYLSTGSLYERRNHIASALELHHSCTYPSMYWLAFPGLIAMRKWTIDGPIMLWISLNQKWYRFQMWLYEIWCNICSVRVHLSFTMFRAKHDMIKTLKNIQNTPLVQMLCVLWVWRDQRWTPTNPRPSWIHKSQHDQPLHQTITSPFLWVIYMLSVHETIKIFYSYHLRCQRWKNCHKDISQ